MDDTQPVPSKVLHLRNLPESVRENEVASLALPFGRVANILLLRQKSQALLEMEDVPTATALVSYYNQLPATLRYGVCHVCTCCYKFISCEGGSMYIVSVYAWKVWVRSLEISICLYLKFLFFTNV